MIKTINQRVFLVGLAPLALLALVLVIWNGVFRIREAEQQLSAGQLLTRQLLNTPALDALVIGNTLTFQQLSADVIKTSHSHVCIALLDTKNTVITTAGSCNTPAVGTDLFPLTVNRATFSDFPDTSPSDAQAGFLRVSMNDQTLLLKKKQILLQLIFSVGLILAVVVVVIRSLRARLVIPIQRMDAAMDALSRREYDLTLEFSGDDEVGRLGRAIDDTARKIQTYTNELLRRRDEATRALHDADEANLARNGLVRSLTDELQSPLNQLHVELTTLAVSNTESATKSRIKSILGTLNQTQSNLDDLLEIATSSPRATSTRLQDFSAFTTELGQTITVLSSSTGLPLQFEMSTASVDEIRHFMFDVDIQRYKKAVDYIIRAMFQHCSNVGVYVHLDVIKVSDSHVNISLHLKAFYENPAPGAAATNFKVSQPHAKAPPTLLQWSDRECKIVEYLLHEIGLTASYTASSTGTVSILLETLARYSTSNSTTTTTTEWATATKPIHTVIVTDDFALVRFSQRGAVSQHDIKLVPLAAAVESSSQLLDADAIIIDTCDDVASAFRLVDIINAVDFTKQRRPRLLALCAAGTIGNSLETRLFDCGFDLVLQRPLQFGRLTETIQRVVTQSLTTSLVK